MKSQHNFLSPTLQKKYQKLHSRLKKAIRSGRFLCFSDAKKRQLLLCLSRYERKLKHCGISFACGLSLLIPTDILAQPIPVGDEFRVNTTVEYWQHAPSVSMDSDGDFVIVWSDNYKDGHDYGIFAQRYNKTGVSQGNEFQVNTYTTGAQDFPSMAMDNDGNFVVTWDNSNEGNGPGAQRYNKEGIVLGDEIYVTANAPFGPQTDPSVAMDSDGDFVIVMNNPSGGLSQFDIYAQRFDNAGTKLGNQFKVNTHTTSSQFNPSIAMDDDGNFVVARAGWEQDGNQLGIFAQRYDNTGVAQGNEFQINTYTTGIQENPVIAMDGDGDFVIGWESEEQDGGDLGIYAQRYDNAGAAKGNEFRINSYTTGPQHNPSVAMDINGNFVFAWDNGDSLYAAIYAQAYNNAGIPVGNEFQVNTSIVAYRGLPSIGMDNTGNFVVAWQGLQADGEDGDVYAQRYENITATTAIDKENESFAVLHIFPVPTEIEVTVEINTLSDTPLTMTVLNALGQEVKKSVAEVQRGINTIKVDVNLLPAGYYYIQLNNGKETIGTPFIKQ